MPRRWTDAGDVSRAGGLRRTLSGPLLALVTVVVTLGVLEMIIRVASGQTFTTVSRLPRPAAYAEEARAAYDPRLGWIPRVGSFSTKRRGTWSVNDDGLRSNGGSAGPSRPVILALGDSFTFGDEVADRETWPAQLGRMLDARVLNAGVFAYGVDQAFLRGTQLIETYAPDVVLFAFISHDVTRAEFSYFSRPKPYFEYENGELVQRNVPVPTGDPPPPALDGLRRSLGYSLLFSWILPRVAGDWWYSAVRREHRDGEAVTVDLMGRLHSTLEARDARLIVIALGLREDGDAARTQRVVAEARVRGLEVLDLTVDVDGLVPEDQARMFMDGGHYSAEMNTRVAARVKDLL